MKISDKILDKCYAHGIKAFPEEACGIITNNLDVYHMPNIMNKYHKLDPKEYPRTNLDGFFINPKELLNLEEKLKQQNQKIIAIYHTHPKDEAYLSKYDREIALSYESFYPGMHHLVLSVKDNKPNGVIIVVFNQDKGDFEITKI